MRREIGAHRTASRAPRTDDALKLSPAGLRPESTASRVFETFRRIAHRIPAIAAAYRISAGESAGTAFRALGGAHFQSARRSGLPKTQVIDRT
jgi:hypothetical protein